MNKHLLPIVICLWIGTVCVSAGATYRLSCLDKDLLKKEINLKARQISKQTETINSQIWKLQDAQTQIDTLECRLDKTKQALDEALKKIDDKEKAGEALIGAALLGSLLGL